MRLGGSTLPNTVYAACRRISVIAVFAVSAKDCGVAFLFLSCASRLQMVGVIFATC